MTPQPPPRAWVDPWPHGPTAAGTPAAAAWVAELAQHLAATGLDATAIADATHLDVRTVTGVLEGSRWPTFRTATVLAALDVHADDLA